MSLIEMFTDYVYNKKDLREYVQKRKNLHGRGEFNDATLILAQENLERLKEENPKMYDAMYDTLEEYVKLGNEQPLEYPIDFIRIVSRLYKQRFTVEKMYTAYRAGLQHRTYDL